MLTTPDPQSLQDTILTSKGIKFNPFSLPGFSGGTYAAFLNTDTTRALFVALLNMEPGALLEFTLKFF